MDLISKLPDVGTTIFSEMSTLANEEDALNLSQGFPEFDCDKRLQELVTKAMHEGKNQYAPMPGLPQLREVLAGKVSSSYDIPCSPEDITITSGATEAIYAVIAATVSMGDEVIIFDPAYDCYDPAVRLNGGVPIHIDLPYPGFRLPLEELEKSISESTKLVVLNNPHNPLGTVCSHDEMLELERILVKHDVLLLSDEVYEHIVFDGFPHKSALCYEQLRQRSFVTFSFGKTFHNTGWKLGYCIAPESLTTEIRKAHQYIVFSSFTPAQFALAEYLKDPSVYQGLDVFYQRKRDIFLESVRDSKFKALPCSGTYFALLSYADITHEQDFEFAKKLTREHKIASIPISGFYANRADHKLLRFCFAKEDQTLIKAGEILCQI